MIGKTLGHYRIVEKLGEGGMGEVYRAHDSKLGRDVAIKCLPDAFTGDADRVMRFEREARTLATLNHPSIAQIYGLEQVESTRALVMELVDGEDLSVRIGRGALTLDEAIPIARQIVDALAAAHEAGIVHRDLKPANIKVKDDGTVKVLDFGLAKALERHARSETQDPRQHGVTITSPAMTGAGIVLGTAAYMSPEQAKGRPVDKRTDVWAFGCVLFEMLTGRRAFDGEDVSEVLAAILRSEPEWTALPPLSAPLTLLLKRCLERDARKRIGDMSGVRFVIDDLSGLPAPVTHQPTAASQYRAAWMLTATVAIIAAVVGAFMVGRRSVPIAAPDLTVTRFSLPMPESQSLGDRRLALSPDGKSLAYVSDTELFVRRLSEFSARPVAIIDAGPPLASPAFSPDGESIVFYSRLHQAIKRVSLQGGAAQRVCETTSPASVSWDTTGVLLGMGGQGVVRCDPAGGAPQQVLAAEAGEFVISPQLLGDDAVLFTSGPRSGSNPGRWDKSKIVVQSIKTGARRVLVDTGADGRVVGNHLLYRFAGILYAVKFDVQKLETQGDRVAVIDGLARASVGPSQLSISDRGTIAYVPGPVGVMGSERLIATADRTGAMTKLAITPGPFTQVRASPDGKQLAIASDDGKDATILVIALDGSTTPRRLTINGQNRFPVWSPDGQWLAFQSTRESERGIYRQRADGSGTAERLTTARDGEDHAPSSWSPDGVLAFDVRSSRPPSGTGPPSSALWVLTVATGKAEPFANVTSIDRIAASFSPDGRWIAYARTSSLEPQAPDRGVFVQPFPANGSILQAPRQLVDYHPVWSAGGKELIFLASTTARQMAAVSIATSGTTLTFGRLTRFPATVTGNTLSSAPRSFDVLPDGRLIGLVNESDSLPADRSAELFVVLNWLTELRRRVP